MEGMQVANAINGLIVSIGLVPSFLLAGVCIYFVIRETKKQTSALKEALSSMSKKSDAQDEKLENTLKELKTSSDKAIKTLSDEVKYIQTNYVTKEEHFRDFEGWRAEIKDLRDLIVQALITKDK